MTAYPPPEPTVRILRALPDAAIAGPAAAAAILLLTAGLLRTAPGESPPGRTDR